MNEFPILLPGLDAVSSEWVLFSGLWLLAAIATFARFFGLATGSLTARLQATPAGISLGVPGMILIFLSIIGHFAVMAAIVAEVGRDGALSELAKTLYALLSPLGGMLEAVIPPLAILGRLQWDYAILAWLLVMAAEVLLWPALKASQSVMRGKQNDILADIQRKSGSGGYNY